MVQVYADGALVYDPNVDGYELLGLTVNVGTDIGGTAEIVMPPDHPAYNSFVNYKTLIEIYRHGELIFRGRALYPTDDFDRTRTITCEGERCFLNDAVVEPYEYHTDPRDIFVNVLKQYNAHTDAIKRFGVGEITVRDPNDYQYIKCDSASYVSDVIAKLLEYVGGYITFTDSPTPGGPRRINWLASLDTKSGQVIEFGENLLDYSRTDANTELATVIYPYGAQDEKTGKRVDIKGVNNGWPYIKDDEAVALRGWIAKPVFWDDVTLPENLLKKARAYLNSSKLIVSSLEVGAVDLSVIDLDIDAFRVGSNVRVISLPHGVDEMFLLRERTYDLLDPSKDKITLGKNVVTLTGTSAANYRSTSSKIVSSSYSGSSSSGSSGSSGGSGSTGSGSTGVSGKDGTTFTPSVSEAGVISWTNDGGLDNPTPVNIKGPQGETGATGATGATGPAGPTGADGADGEDGVGIVSITQTPTTGDGGVSTITVTLSNEETQTFTVKNGSKGSTGAPGADGVSPTVSMERFDDATGTGVMLTIKGADSMSSQQIFDGATGPQGEKGDTGDTGPQGEQGPQGETGATGEDGVGIVSVTLVEI